MAQLNQQQLGMQVPHPSTNPDPKSQPSQEDELKALTFSGPIPGQSLTDEPGNHPWETPPQFADKEDAMNFIMDQMTEPQHAVEIFKLFKKGISVEEMARVIIFTGFTQGQWTVDTGMLIYHPVMMGLIALAHRAGLDDTPVVMKHRFANLEDRDFQELQMQNAMQPTHDFNPPPQPEEAPPASAGFMERPQ